MTNIPFPFIALFTIVGVWLLISGIVYVFNVMLCHSKFGDILFVDDKKFGQR